VHLRLFCLAHNRGGLLHDKLDRVPVRRLFQTHPSNSTKRGRSVHRRTPARSWHLSLGSAVQRTPRKLCCTPHELEAGVHPAAQHLLFAEGVSRQHRAVPKTQLQLHTVKNPYGHTPNRYLAGFEAASSNPVLLSSWQVYTQHNNMLQALCNVQGSSEVEVRTPMQMCSVGNRRNVCDQPSSAAGVMCWTHCCWQTSEQLNYQLQKPQLPSRCRLHTSSVLPVLRQAVPAATATKTAVQL
jgi:hypothetical protein